MTFGEKWIKLGTINYYKWHSVLTMCTAHKQNHSIRSSFQYLHFHWLPPEFDYTLYCEIKMILGLKIINKIDRSKNYHECFQNWCGLIKFCSRCNNMVSRKNFSFYFNEFGTNLVWANQLPEDIKMMEKWIWYTLLETS